MRWDTIFILVMLAFAVWLLIKTIRDDKETRKLAKEIMSMLRHDNDDV